MRAMRNGLAAGCCAALLALFAACGGGGERQLPPMSAGSGDETPPSSPPATVTPTASPTPTATPVPDLAAAEQILRDGDAATAAAAYRQLAERLAGEERARAYLGAGAAAHAGGDPEDGIAALREAVAAAPAGSAVGVEAAYLLGRRLNDAGRYAEALEALGPDAEGAGTLAPYWLAELARAASGVGDVAAAEGWQRAILADPRAPAALAAEGYRALAEAAARDGDPAARSAWLTRLLEVEDTAATRFALAEAAREAGDLAGWAAQLEGIVYGFPNDRLAREAAILLGTAGIAVDLAQQGFVLYRAGYYAEAQAVLEALLAEPGEQLADYLAFATFYLAASLEDQGLLAESVPLYDRVVELAPDAVYAHRARYWAARVSESLGNSAEASQRYVALASGPPGEFSAEGAFRAGYVLYVAGDPAGAAAAWEQVAPSARVLYWLGRAREAAGLPVEAQAAYEAAIAAGPLDFHGLAAARRFSATQEPHGYQPQPLAGTVDWAAIESWLTANAGPGTPPEGSPLAERFARMGLAAEAAGELYALADGGAWPSFTAARQAHQLGLVSAAARLAERLRIYGGATWATAPSDLLRVAYPVGYPALVDAAARAWDVDPLLLAALIRTESFWEPSAVSFAGAIGLAQVMPETGEWIAEALGAADFTVADLLQPAVSIRYGAYYLGAQLETFGQPHVALSAYNAGPGRAERWAAGGAEDAVEYAEGVDILETRYYVEHVLEDWARYRVAYGAADDRPADR